MSTADPDPTAAPAEPPYIIPPQDLRDMVLTLPRPPADAPESAWQEVVQGGLDRLGVLDPRDALRTMLAVTVIATHAGAVDACRLAFAPDTSAVQAPRQRASATALARVMAGAMRSLKQLRLQPAVPARDWGGAAAVLAAALREAPARPAEAAGEPALPVKPGPRRIYKYKNLCGWEWQPGAGSGSVCVPQHEGATDAYRDPTARPPDRHHGGDCQT
ncbi:MAG TPA: hypothetical protein VFE41_26175, partial [Acetobacteraceae bacterium]|nr:hypothetical protein [Acetobacteraceae bacterium]